MNMISVEQLPIRVVSEKPLNCPDKSGERSGRWLVLPGYKRTPRGDLMWLCRCDCGTTRFVIAGNLGRSLSCGCKRLDSHLSHGALVNRRSKELRDPVRYRLHGIWVNMRARCLNPNTPNFHRYGGRGITVCEEWMNFKNFERDMGPSHEIGLDLDRENNGLGYCKSNCRWVTHIVNTNNTDKTKRYTAFGKTMTLRGWSDSTGILKETLRFRLRAGWNMDQALTASVKRGQRHDLK